MENAIELRSKLFSDTTPLSAVEKAGDFIAKSGMFGCERKEQGMIIAATCYQEGLSFLEFKRTYHNQNGELSMRADAMLAEFHKRGFKSKLLSRDAEKASIELTTHYTAAFTFTWDDAKAEPFVYGKDGRTIKKNYATPRARMQMLWARVISDGVRTMCPEIVAGTYTPEEVQDFESIKTVTTQPILKTEAKTEPPQTVSISEPQAQVIDVQAEPEQPAQPVEFKTAPMPIPSIDPATGRITTETVLKLEEVIGSDNAAKALKFLISKGALKPEEGLLNLNLDWTKRILANPTGFNKKINE